jgi:hypothetical protein
VLHLIQHLLRLRQLLLRGLMQRQQHVYLLRQPVALLLQQVSFLAYELEFLRRSIAARRDAVGGCSVLLHRRDGLLRRSMQHCGVNLVAHPEEFRRVHQVFRIEGEAARLHGTLNGGTRDTTGTRGLPRG